MPLALVRGSRNVALAFAAALCLMAPPAAGSDNAAAPAAIPRPPAPPGDGAAAERLLAEVEAKAKAQGAAAQKVVAEPAQAARGALERAHGARVSGDAAHARMLDGLALEWAETARDLQRGATAESSASDLADKAADVATQVERARALLSETQDRRGRAAAELERLEAEARSAGADAAVAEDSRVHKKNGAPAPKAEKKAGPAEAAKPAKPKGAADPKGAPKGPPNAPKGAPKTAPKKGSKG